MTTLGKPPLVHEVLRDRLRGQIGERWRVGDRLPTIKDLARAEGVNEVSTYRAVRALANEGLLVARPRHGTFVASLPSRNLAKPVVDSAAGALAGKRVTVFHPANDGFIVPAIETFRSRIEPSGAILTIRDLDPHHVQHVIDGCPDEDAIVTVNMSVAECIHANGNQLLVVVSNERGQSINMSNGYDFVGVNCEQGGFLAGEHARLLGCRDAAFIGKAGPGEGGYAESSVHRLRGFEHGLGQAVPPECRLRVRFRSAECGAAAVGEYLALAPRPQIIFAVADKLAIGFIHGALAHGLMPGVDYQIIGFDGKQEGRDLTCGPLTTIDTPMAEMADSAAQLLIRRASHPQCTVRHLSLGCTLFQGVTTRSLQKESKHVNP